MAERVNKPRAAVGKVVLSGVRMTSTIIMAMLVAMTVFLLLGSLTSYFRILTVMSGSMEPTIPTGALILVTPMKRDQVKVGDILTLQHPEQPDILLTHRVATETQQDSKTILQTKGDANAAIDPWRVQLVSDTIWKTRVIVPVVGYVFEWLRDSFQNILLLLGIPILFGFLWVRMIWRRRNNGAKATS